MNWHIILQPEAWIRVVLQSCGAECHLSGKTQIAIRLKLHLRLAAGPGSTFVDDRGGGGFGRMNH